MSDPIPQPTFIWPDTAPINPSIVCCASDGNIYFNSLTTDQHIKSNDEIISDLKLQNCKLQQDLEDLKKCYDEQKITIEKLQQSVKYLIEVDNNIILVD